MAAVETQVKTEETEHLSSGETAIIVEGASSASTQQHRNCCQQQDEQHLRHHHHQHQQQQQQQHHQQQQPQQQQQLHKALSQDKKENHHRRRRQQQQYIFKQDKKEEELLHRRQNKQQLHKKHKQEQRQKLQPGVEGEKQQEIQLQFQHPRQQSPAQSEVKEGNPNQPQEEQQLQRAPQAMPIAINANSRPPSAPTVPSGSPTGGPPRTIPTSRRGGRQRSRSPPVMGNRLPGSSNDSMPQASSTPGENPSSAAAAAAAAAAQAYSNNAASGRNPVAQWPEQGSSLGVEDHTTSFHTAYDKPYTGSSRNWPADDQTQGSYGGGPSQRGGRYESGPYAGEGYHQATPGGHYRSPAEDSTAFNDPRFREPQRCLPYESNENSRAPHPGRTQAGAAAHFPQSDFRYRQNGREQIQIRGAAPKANTAGTSLVMGGTTPIHLPKPVDPHSTGEQRQRGGTPASVFRGRPAASAGTAGHASTSASAAVAMDDVDEASHSPQKILLSLRTPTTSFEEKGPAEKDRKTSGLPLSPDDPPQLHNFSQQQRPSEQLFERSPEGSKNSGSIEMAPSFTLFNQSFDSFGDAHYFNVDATLQADSFGMGRTTSVDNDPSTQLLQRNSSGGNFSQQFLAASGSGALTIGYSPVNSFGNASIPVASRRTGTVTVLGGPDPRTASPTQVLGMYRSYSGGGASTHRAGPLDDSHLRMSVGSFGAQPASYPGRSYGESSGSPNYYFMGPSCSHDSVERNPPFYTFLRKYKAAFKDCSFLLPGLKAALLETPLSDGKEEDASSAIDVEGSVKGQKWEPTVKSSSGQFLSPNAVGPFTDPSPQEIAVARRRVESSVCAFGGNLNRDRAVHSQDNGTAGRPSIFRGQEDPEDHQSATVTPSSSTGSPKGHRFQSRARLKYEEDLPGRYYENESRLSWEFEECPPVELYREDDHDGEKMDADPFSSKNGVDGRDSKAKSEGDSYCKPTGDDSAGKRHSATSPQPKMRYRCKLCGQPKQNHTCPYQQSLARSIGIMVYPAVNAFAASEPGTIAPALSDMNNFVDSQKESSPSESSPNRPTPDRLRQITSGTAGSTQVTPESMRSSPRQLPSPSSFTASPGRTGNRRNGIGRRGGTSVGKKRSYSQLGGGTDDHSDLLFVDSMELKPEQFRVVTLTKAVSARDAFNYPALPLPYAQRKRLSDNLFSLSNEVPKLTDECAQVLREAREKDMWDLAVAELMTQVVVIIHCPEGDNRFEGLRQYLLTLGIAC